VKIKIKKELLENPGIRSFLIRLAIFLLIYTVISIYHPFIIQRYHYYLIEVTDKWLFLIMYPILFFFIFLRWSVIKEIKPYKNSPSETLLFLIAAVITFITPVRDLVLEGGFDPITAVFLPVYLSYVFLFLAVFNMKFVHKFSKEIKFAAIILFSYLFINVLIDEYWELFSGVIVWGLDKVLPLIDESTRVNPDNFNIVMKGFSVYVGPPCAGVYSIVTFVLLFGLAVNLAKRNNKIHKLKAFFAFVSGICLVFLFNIIRVGIIVYVGAFHSPELAIELFHEYLSSIFLIFIFAFYLYLVLPRICVGKRKK
jgi:exosortase/archaeosortase family protein